MCEITWGGYIALPPSSHQHCTDEAQKAETVLSAVSYIYIYIYPLLDRTEDPARARTQTPSIHSSTGPRRVLTVLY